MKAIISCTPDSLYSFFIPITTWCWNRLGVDVILFVPGKVDAPLWLAMGEINKDNSNRNLSYGFNCPKNKEATYAQCSRLFAASLDLPEDEILITSDVDMALFNTPLYKNGFSFGFEVPGIEIIGSDLTPNGQYPMCYIVANVKTWKKVFDIGNKSYQSCLDNLLGHEEMENMRGNLWARDQETVYKKISSTPGIIVSKSNRARPGTQFAERRLDRDDAYIFDRLDQNIIDFHMPRPGYEENAFSQILTVLRYFYPNESFEWLINYRNEYLKLL